MTNDGKIDSHVAVVRESAVRGLRLVEKSYTRGLRMPRHSHAEWRYCLALRGSYTDSWRRSTRTRTPNQLSLHPAEESHTTAFHTAARCLHIEYVGEWQQRLLGDAGIAPEPHEFLGGQVASIAARMHDELVRGDAAGDPGSALVLEGLACELIGWSARALRGESAGASWVYAARDLLRDRFRETLTLADIAEAVGAQPVQLARQFRRTFGCTIGEYVRRRRVDFACRALRTAEPLSLVGLDAGFADQSHFSRVFKRVTGRTPGEYRRGL
jgi:AraC-like DNA-binding protein